MLCNAALAVDDCRCPTTYLSPPLHHPLPSLAGGQVLMGHDTNPGWNPRKKALQTSWRSVTSYTVPFYEVGYWWISFAVSQYTTYDIMLKPRGYDTNMYTNGFSNFTTFQHGIQWSLMTPHSILHICPFELKMPVTCEDCCIVCSHGP